MRVINGTPTHLILFADGRAANYPVHCDPHTGGEYVYRRNANGLYVRVYVAPGESVEYFEAADPLLATAA